MITCVKIGKSLPHIHKALLVFPMLLMLTVNTFAAPPRTIDHTVVLVNEGGNFGLGSIVTFSEGSKRNSRPKYFAIGVDPVGQVQPQIPNGIAISPVTHETFVTYLDSNEVARFAPDANGRTSPLTILSGPESALELPFGIAFDSMASPIVDTSGQIYVSNLDAINVYDGPDGDSGAPNFVITEFLDFFDPLNFFDADVTDLNSPAGLFVDEAPVTACVGSADSAADLCNPESGNTIVTVMTRRIWVVNEVGYVTIYAPELANAPEVAPYLAIAVESPTASPCVTVANAAGTAPATTEFCDEPPLGGFFFTNRNVNDPTDPLFLAVSQDERRAYVSDSDGGPQGNGRIRNFQLASAPFCLVNFGPGGDCNLAIQNFEIAVPTERDLMGPHTRINQPDGISVAPTVAGDELFVANFGSNSVLEFAPGVAAKGGDVAPRAIISSPTSPIDDLCPAGTIPSEDNPCKLPTFTPNTALNIPVGTALSPPVLIFGPNNQSSGVR